eukprot:TRINITY_DN2653_c0_g1_i1.p3 TRINITY_DN2653_c0_g1~~TRINITY_DN2653_c0_g1_i1.p3  ORF type:complete len:104 (-),score=0.05 TRINITY_DN2653_c0_g1_i1:710-1021(-)
MFITFKLLEKVVFQLKMLFKNFLFSNSSLPLKELKKQFRGDVLSKYGIQVYIYIDVLEFYIDTFDLVCFQQLFPITCTSLFCGRVFSILDHQIILVQMLILQL